MKLKKIVNNQRMRRRFRVRNKVRGTSTQPRLCVKRTLRHFSVQLIDDEAGKTLASASTLDQVLVSADAASGNSSNCGAAARVGKLLAERALSVGVKQVRMDRGHCRYHGRVAAFADAAREAGLVF